MKAAAVVRWNPDRLDVRAFAQAGASVAATEPVTGFARLSAELPQGADSGAWTVQWEAQGETRADPRSAEAAVWLRLLAQAELPLTCQRCLGPVPTRLEVDRWFRFVIDEATAAQQDEDSEEDVLALEPRPSLHDLLEDELLMALPLVPMHETCPTPVVMSVGAAPDAEQSDGPHQPHPFASLASLKK